MEKYQISDRHRRWIYTVSKFYFNEVNETHIEIKYVYPSSIIYIKLTISVNKVSTLWTLESSPSTRQIWQCYIRRSTQAKKNGHPWIFESWISSKSLHTCPSCDINLSLVQRNSLAKTLNLKISDTGRCSPFYTGPST